TGGILKPKGLFETTEETLTRLLRLCNADSIALNPPIYCDHKQEKIHGDLLHLEENFGKINPLQNRQTPQAIELWCAENPHDEARLAVELALELKTQNGWRWDDIGILTRDLATYAVPLERAFHALKV